MSRLDLEAPRGALELIWRVPTAYLENIRDVFREVLAAFIRDLLKVFSEGHTVCFWGLRSVFRGRLNVFPWILAACFGVIRAKVLG